MGLLFYALNDSYAFDILPAVFRSFRTKEEAAEFCLLVSISGVVVEVRDTRRNVMTAWIKDVRI